MPWTKFGKNPVMLTSAMASARCPSNFRSIFGIVVGHDNPQEGATGAEDQHESEVDKPSASREPHGTCGRLFTAAISRGTRQRNRQRTWRPHGVLTLAIWAAGNAQSLTPLDYAIFLVKQALPNQDVKTAGEGLMEFPEIRHEYNSTYLRGSVVSYQQRNRLAGMRYPSRGGGSVAGKWNDYHHDQLDNANTIPQDWNQYILAAALALLSMYIIVYVACAVPGGGGAPAAEGVADVDVTEAHQELGVVDPEGAVVGVARELCDEITRLALISEESLRRSELRPDLPVEQREPLAAAVVVQYQMIESL